jgi:hypothetical protein
MARFPLWCPRRPVGVFDAEDSSAGGTEQTTAVPGPRSPLALSSDRTWSYGAGTSTLVRRTPRLRTRDGRRGDDEQSPLEFVEAPSGFEPENGGFADRSWWRSGSPERGQQREITKEMSGQWRHEHHENHEVDVVSGTPKGQNRDRSPKAIGACPPGEGVHTQEANSDAW